ncbi:MAG: ABC transporter ATP-binding protein [Actinomycetota bacterium]|nr:ABC transporter ATP-binding protein [Actinomycetota bacterium]
MLISRGESFQLNLSLSIPPGRTVALLGPNGAGKSTAVAVLAGLLPVDSGLITLAGVTLDEPDRGVFVPAEARRVGVVFQDYLLFPHLTVVENVAFGLRSGGVNREDSMARAGEWLERVDLAEHARKKPGDLSGGQAQRVALARALVTEPDLLLLDEPLAALDVTTRVQLRRALLEHLDRFSGPRLFITHDPTEAFLLADEINIIEGGRVTQTGPAEDIRLRPRTPYAADLAGSNLVPGVAEHGVVDTGSHLIHIADHDIAGSVLATIRPAAISVHLREPEGSPRNAWKTTVDLIEHLGERARLSTGAPLPLTVEVTDEAARALHLAAGAPIWVSIKATEITVQTDA